MSSTPVKSPPPDQPQRHRAQDPVRSILVQAPAGSGKTDLLTRRFLRLLAEVEEPGQIVAITFTIAAAAEMRHRILSELEKAASDAPTPEADEFSMEALARRALKHSNALGWRLLDLPAQLHISTIDSFCRDLALQQPLVSGLGGGLAIAAQPDELYRRAARQTIEQIDKDDPLLSEAIAALLEWHDNNWQDVESLLVQMLGQRDRWMHDFLLQRDPNWTVLRERLERPFANAVHEALSNLSLLFRQVPEAFEESLRLARFACEQSGGQLHRELAELAEFPSGPFPSNGALEEASQAYVCLAELLLTSGGAFRKQVNVRQGFPADRKQEKVQLLDLIDRLKTIPGLESALAAVSSLPPARYTDDDWLIVRACFTLLRRAAAELEVVFAEAAAVDFIEVAQIAQRVLKGPDGLPTDAALAVADGIRHLLVDEFQDTSRRQHQLLANLISAWPERTGRTCFVVGDPMQSIYFFRDADAELFPRVRDNGLEIPSPDPLLFDFVPLSSNFRTAPSLVERLNQVFDQVFAAPDGSGVTFSSVQPAREATVNAADPRFNLHLNFVPKASRGKTANLWPNAPFFPLHRNPHGVVIPPSVASGKRVRDNGTQPSFTNSDDVTGKETARDAQVDEIVALIQTHADRIEQARKSGGKYRVAVLGRTRNALAPIAQAFREAEIPFCALDLEKLKDRPEVLDALSLARAVLSPHDRVAWLGVLRAPWCGLTLDDLHRLTSADDRGLLARPVPELLAERFPLLTEAGRSPALRVLETINGMPQLRASQPTASLGTWLEQIWLRLGGSACVDATARANLDLLWGCLDRLPGGEPDLLGPALNEALDKLTALPDPESNSDCGVQLMTIHKAKGLEFEVVIVPDLQAASGRGSRKLLSWLERGLAHPDESGDITEFLIAPLQSKGADRGKAKEWVDRVYRQRESQEDRRILYVAATRAREELHLFARPAYKVEAGGSLSLADPTASLLATAWPALEEEVRARFEDWKTAAAPVEAEIESLAASAESNLLVMPSPAKPTLLCRLPPGYQPEQPTSESPTPAKMQDAPSFRRLSGERAGSHESQPSISSPVTEILGAPEPALSLPKGLDSETWESTLYPRHQGGRLSRALGVAVHALLEELARLRTSMDWIAARAALQRFEPRIAAQVRASGVDQVQAATIAAQALQLAHNASQDPVGQWILSPRAEAGSEIRWAGVVAGNLHTVQVDRVFRAGLNPQSEGRQAWWIVDYKIAHAGTPGQDPAAALPELRKLFSPQIEAYAQILRNLHGADAILRAGLYYPSMLLLDWWEV